jgi:FkbM family methyltransferase
MNMNMNETCIRLRMLAGRLLRLLGLRRDPRAFVTRARGVIHIGANDGQERDFYAKNGLEVLWIEALPEVFDRLQANLKDFPQQQAVCALVTDVTDEEVEFHVANNSQHSSSLFPMQAHKILFPDIEFTHTVKLRTIKLADLLEREGVRLDRYDTLVLDVQGAELLVLRGAGRCLHHFQFVMLEAADCQAYQGACLLGELDVYLKQQGFRQAGRHGVIHKRGTGTYYDVLYSNVQHR